MNLLLSTILALPIQAPAEQAPAPLAEVQQRLDVVLLKNGDELVGQITAELDSYVEVRIEDGATIGISRAQVKAVRRGVTAAPVRRALVRPEDAWFVLHDADGASVGWLHTSVTARQDGSFAVNEEYEFVNGVRRYQVTNRCTADAQGRPVRCYFRERVSKPRQQRQLAGIDPLASDDRVEDERIIEAVVVGEALEVSRLDGRGRRLRQLPWSSDATFSLLARAMARCSATCIGPTSMFDPRHDELRQRSADGRGSRQMMIDGVRQRVGEVTLRSADGAQVDSRSWIGRDRRVLRRELAGPALVAVPSSAGSARAAVGARSIPSALVAESEGRFGLWVPSPAWRTLDDLPPGHLALSCEVHDAAIRLSLLDHLEPDARLETAADAVGNWFALLYPRLEVSAKFRAQVRGRSTVRMRAGDARNAQQATIDVMPFDGRFLVLICRAPRSAWDELAPDFTFVRKTLELDAAALTPSPTGPLRRQRTGASKQPAGPLPAPTPARRVGGSTSSSGDRGAR